MIERRGRIAIVRVDNPPVNALSHPVRLGLCAGLQAAAAEADVILLAGVRGRFVVGADIKELDQEIAPPDLLDIERVIASVRPPVVAVVEGEVLGGGLLLALMCDMRVSSAGAMFGYPEVALGLLPTFSGTQLTPRLCGAAFALEWMSSGTTLNAEDARARGLVDGVLSAADLAAGGDLIGAAEAWLTRNAAAKRRALNLPWPEEPIAPLQALRDEVSKAAPGFLAPVRIAQAVLNGFEMGLDKALEQEARLFAELRQSDQSKALRRLFFAERAAGKEARSKSGYPWSPGLMSEVGWSEVVVEESGQSLPHAQGAAWLSRSVVVRGRSAACALADAFEGELQAIHADPRDQAELLRSIGFSRGATVFWTGADADVTAIDEEKYARLRRALSAAGEALLRDGVVSEPERLNVVMTAALGWPRFRTDLF